MLQGISNGLGLIEKSFRIFNRHPTLLLPLLFTWLLYAPAILLIKYGIHWDTIDNSIGMVMIFGFVFFFAFLLTLSCSMLLELIQQLESGKPLRILQAFRDTISQNIFKLLPLILVWAVIWFILLVIQALLSKRKGRRAEREVNFSAENAAKTLAGHGRISLTGAFFLALQKGVRMIMFLILPAIAWENLGFITASKRGIAVFKAHVSEFITGFILTESVALLLFLPPVALMYISDEMRLNLPESVWLVTIVYLAFAWSYSIYLEQMFSAELYLWNLKWEKETKQRYSEAKPAQPLFFTRPPTLLDEVPELLPSDQKLQPLIDYHQNQTPVLQQLSQE